MKNLLSLLLLCSPAFAADTAPAAKDPFKSDDERIVYALGRALGQNVAPFSLSPSEQKVLLDGVRDELAGKKSPIEVAAYRARINELLRTRMGALAEKEKAKGREYAAAFKKEQGVKDIPGGGLYKMLAEGKGDGPAPEDTVKVHYRGTLIDGTEFDSSYKRGEPIETTLQGGLISCWLKGIPMLKKGGKAKLVCPSDVAYGDDGRPPTIKGGATLVFEVELVDVTKAKGDKKKG